jgi:predicted DNA-binding transcriptional regulator AlpA
MPSRLMDIRELGDYLGYSHETIRKQLQLGTFPIPPAIAPVGAGLPG